MSVFRDTKVEKELIREEIIEEHEEERQQQIVRRYKEDYSNSQKMIKPFIEIFARLLAMTHIMNFRIRLV